MRESDFIMTKMLKKKTSSPNDCWKATKRNKRPTRKKTEYTTNNHMETLLFYKMARKVTWWHHRQRRTVFPDVHGRSFALGYVHKQPPQTEDEKLLKIAFSNQICFLGFFISIILNPLHALQARLTTIFHLFPVTRNLALIVSLLAAGEMKKLSYLRLHCNNLKECGFYERCNWSLTDINARAHWHSRSPH